MRHSLSAQQLHDRQHSALAGATFRLRKYEVTLAVDGRIEAVTLTLESLTGDLRVLLLEKPEFDSFSPLRAPDEGEAGPIYVIDRAVDGYEAERRFEVGTFAEGVDPYLWAGAVCVVR